MSFMVKSVAVGNVPDAPSGGIDQVVCSTAALTSAAVCLQTLHRDGLQKGVGCIDAVIIEEGLCHGEVGWFHGSFVCCSYCRSVEDVT